MRDLSRVGATAESALSLAGHVDGPDALAIAEIGGNNVLGNTPPDAFARGLDALLGRLEGDGRTVVLLELPLPPFANESGAIQRRAARRHHALLIPKRLLMEVLTGGDATLDSIHLSRSGHREMADAIWSVIRPAFEPGGGPPAR